MKIPKIKISNDTNILINQAEIISGTPLNGLESDLIGAEDNALRRAARVLDLDYLNPLVKPTKIQPGDIADPGPLMTFLETTEQDLKTIEKTGKAVSELLRQGHNIISTKENQVVSQLKILRERLSALKLYSLDKSGSNEVVRYSFGEGERLIPTEKECSLNPAEGSLTLPIKAINKATIKKISIEESSIGSLGNSRDRSRDLHNNLLLALDGNDNTWFEFESFGNNSTGGLAKLILKLELAEPQVLNKIVINPAIIGSSTWLEIEDIQVNFQQRSQSLKDELSNASWVNEGSQFTLAPANTSFSGQGIYSFPPRMVDAVYLTLKQSTGFPIENGRKFRYCIALREVELFRVEFQEEGNFYFEPAILNKPAVAAGVLENIIGRTGDYIITYSLSYDGGSTWNDIVSLDNFDASLREALFFPGPAPSIVIKGNIKRNPEAFRQDRNQDPVGLIVEEQLVSIGSSVSTGISLTTKPVSFIEVIRAGIGHRGSQEGTYLGTISAQAGETETFRLPLTPERNFSVLVNGVEWPVVPGFSGATRGVLYNANTFPPLIVFGNGTLGMKPQQGSEVYLKLKPLQTPILEEVNGAYSIQLEEQADKIKELSSLFVREPLIRETTISIGPNVNRFILPEGVESISWSPQALYSTERTYTIVDDEVAFVDGYSEFIGLGGLKYSVDLINNQLFVKTPQGNNESNLNLRYTYKAKIEIPRTDWRFDNTENKIISKSPLLTPRVSEILNPVAVASRVISLTPPSWENAEFTIVKNSVVPINLNGIIGITKTLANEVPYQNGASEFIPYLSSLGGLGYYSVDYKNAKIYLPEQANIGIADRGFLAGKITFKYVALEVQYGLGEKLLPEADYKIKDGLVELTPSLVRRLAGSLRSQQSQAVAHVRYDATGAQSIAGALLEPYSSPIVRDIAIVAVSSDPRLSTLERL